jgi:hypothetical protein
MTIEAVQDMRALMDAIEQGLKDNAEYIKKHGNPSIYEGELVSGSEAFPTYELWKFPKDVKVKSEKLIVTQNLEDIKKHLRSQPSSISHIFKVAKNGSYIDLPEFNINSKFANAPTRSEAKSSPGRVKRAGASCKGSATELRKKAKKYSGEKGKMYHWCANMKAGKKRSIREVLD